MEAREPGLLAGRRTRCPARPPSPRGSTSSAWASRPSSLRSHWANAPSPGGSPCPTTSNVPPTVSPALLGRIDLRHHGRRTHAGVARNARDRRPRAPGLPGDRLGVPPRPPRRCGCTWLRSSTPTAERAARARPRRRRASWSRARSRARARCAGPRCRYLSAPARSAWPGRGRLRRDAARFVAAGDRATSHRASSRGRGCARPATPGCPA